MMLLLGLFPVRALSAGPSETLTLHQGWAIQSSANVTAKGDALAKPGYPTAGWPAATVPSTVFGTLVKAGVYRDVFFDKNLEPISREPFKGSWWYRTEFSLGARERGSFSRLIFEGINFRANVWLNGRKIAGQDEVFGVWRRFDLDVTGVLQTGVNALAMEVIPPKPDDFTLGFVDWNPEAPDRNLGLFREVKLRRSGPVSIEDTFVQTRVDLTTLQEASLTITGELVNRSDRACAGVLAGEIDNIHFEAGYALKPRERKLFSFSPEQTPALRLQKPRLWWPVHLGEPNLYELKLRAAEGSDLSDQQAITFGIREVGDFLNEAGHRGYVVNGKKVLIRGGGWVDDLFLNEDEKNLAAQIGYVRQMNLNTIRLEGFWGSSQRLYDLADRHGLLVMVGFSCQWEWENYLGRPQKDDRFGMAKTPEETELLSSYLRDQVRWLRNHPSVFAWVLGSDKLPYPSAEERYRDDLRAVDPTRPYLASCKAWRSPVSGPTGVKMAGPYDYVTPNYWYEDRKNGGAFGFNTETGPGPQVPPLSSLRRMIPADQLWPINPAWDYHCARHDFGNLKKFLTAYDHRYGAAKSVEEFAFKAQASNYEAMRAMFEAFSVNKPNATGVVQWMLNGAWPKMFWQLYDYYLMPSGAFYGARTACQPVNAIYHYGQRAVYLTNDTLTKIPGVTVHTRLYSQDSKIVFENDATLACPESSSTPVLVLPELGQDRRVYFLDLRVEGPGGLIARNFYWLSAQPDVLDPAKGDWTWMPNKTYADFTALGSLPIAEVALKSEFGGGDQGECLVTLTNQSDRIAFFIELQVVRDQSGEPVLPVFWDDNYVSLLPRETRTLRARFAKADLGPERPRLVVQGWNINFIPSRIRSP